MKTQEVINRKHMGLGILKEVAFIVATPGDAGADQLRQDAVEVQKGL